MENDLKYPPGLIASPYKELPMSLLRSGVGSMPGVPLRPTDIDILPAGRGVIPGTGEYEMIPLGLVKSKRYPDADIYSGPAHKGEIIFHSLRLPFLNNVISWVVEKAVELQTRLKGGKMLDLNVWIDESNWKGINTYKWSITWNFYVPGASPLGVVPLVAPAVIIVVAVAAVLALIAIVFILKQVKEIFWGPEDREGVIPSLTTLAMIGGGIFIAALIIKKPKKRKKK